MKFIKNLFSKGGEVPLELPPYEHVLTTRESPPPCSKTEPMTYRLTLKRNNEETIYVFAERWGNICPTFEGVEFRIKQSEYPKPPLFHIKINESLLIVGLELRFPQRFQDLGFKEWTTIKESNPDFFWGGTMGTTLWAGSTLTIEEPEF